MSDLEQMYQQVIMDHAKRGRGKGLVDAQSRRIGESHQVNTTCGDEVTLRVGLTGEHIDSLSWEGAGCSISQASVSAMTEILADTDIDTFEEAFDAFRELMHSRGEPPDDEHLEDLLGDANAFVGVGKYPARIKCAMLGWSALRDALAKAQS